MATLAEAPLREPSVLLRQLEELGKLDVNWDSYGAEPPSDEVIDSAWSLLALCSIQGLTPYRVVPSAEGGVGICFASERRYADIEFLNTGDILAVTSNGMGHIEPFEI